MNKDDSVISSKDDSTGVVTPDKEKTDKLDDASTSDSGSALDAEETSSAEYPISSHLDNHALVRILFIL